MNPILTTEPIPPQQIGRRYRYPEVKQMQVGHCLTVEWAERDRLRMSAMSYGRKSGWKFKTRANKGKNEFKLWRTA